jgi:hypothetical protein
VVDVGDAVRVTARIEDVEDGERPTPDSPLEYVDRRDGTFYFRPA